MWSWPLGKTKSSIEDTKYNDKALELIESDFYFRKGNLSRNTPDRMMMARFLYPSQILILVGASITLVVDSFSAAPHSGGIGITLGRFTASCPADLSYIRRFEASLVDNEQGNSTPKDKDIWVAVYRSNQNQPSVFVRDEFFHAMKAATNGENGDDSSHVDKDRGDASSLPTFS